MAKQAGSVAKFLVKWLVIPVGLAAIGFFVVGPRIGEAPKPVVQPSANPENLPPESESSPTRLREPEVEVTARPAGRVRSPRRRSSRPAENRPEPAAPAPTVEVPVSTPPAGDPPPTDPPATDPPEL